MITFGARWGWPLRLTTLLGMLACIIAGVFGCGQLFRDGQSGPAILILLALPATLGACALFTIRGYSVVPGLLLVHRLFWATAVPLAGLEAVSLEPGVLRWSWRVWGNGGLFAFCGHYWNRRLGWFHAYVTDLKNTVVLRLARRSIVISPDAPEQFVYEIWKAQKSLQH